jgi:hypothetical protein
VRGEERDWTGEERNGLVYWIGVAQTGAHRNGAVLIGMAAIGAAASGVDRIGLVYWIGKEWPGWEHIGSE